MEQEILELYFNSKLKQKEIAEILNVSKYKVSRTVTKDSRYIEEKEDRKRSSDIKHKENTKKIVYEKRKKVQMANSISDLAMRNMHNQASSELSDRKKLTNRAYREWNKSAYTYNENRQGFEFKKELESKRSYDVPKFIKVEVY